MSSPQLVWITGAGGLIGSHLLQTASQWASQWIPIALTRGALDLLDEAAVERRFRNDRPQAVIHCAAISRSAVCQKNPKLAWQTNVEATRSLAQLATEIPFIFLSTDLVFDGSKGNYVESDPVSPLSIYAETKVAAEKIVLENPRHAVVRLALSGGKSPTGDRSFTEDIRHAWERGEKLRFFHDEFRTPIAAAVAAEALWELLEAKQAGIYHLAGSERLSRVEIGELLAALWPDLKGQFESVSLREYQGAPRPPDVSMNCGKLQALLRHPFPKFSDSIRERPADFQARWINP